MADISKIQLPDGNKYDVKDTTKQPLLVSGTNIKTINNNSLLGSGNISIEATVTAMTNQEIEDAVDAGWSEPIVVSISLTSPKHSSGFDSCPIYGLDTDNPSDSNKTLLGTINSSTGNITIQTNQSYLMVDPQGDSIYFNPPTYGTIVISGDIEWDGLHYYNAICIFEVTGSGSIILDQVDYDF